MTPEIYSMGEYLQSEEVEDIVLESTGIYWIPVWDLLYEMGFKLTLVNPYLIKQMLGRKSDIKDAQWIASLLHKGLIRGSFVPPPVIQELRVYSRKHGKLKQHVTRILTVMDSVLVKCTIHASSFLSTINTKSFMCIVDALIAGWTDPLLPCKPGLREQEEQSEWKTERGAHRQCYD